MKAFLAAAVTTLIAAAAGIAVCGAELGGVFWLVAAVALLAPLFATGRSPAEAGVFVGVAVAAGYLLVGDTIDGRQFGQLLLLLAAFVAVLAGVTRLLVLLRVSPTLASGIVAVAALAWLGWPVWISPWVTDDLAGTVVPLHPLLAINGAMPQLGYWQQSRLMYHLTSLGSDVHAPPPDTAYASVIAHAVIAVLVMVPVVAWRVRSSRRPAAAAV